MGFRVMSFAFALTPQKQNGQSGGEVQAKLITRKRNQAEQRGQEETRRGRTARRPAMESH